jgi:hypothetical protein
VIRQVTLYNAEIPQAEEDSQARARPKQSGRAQGFFEPGPDPTRTTLRVVHLFLVSASCLVSEIDGTLEVLFLTQFWLPTSSTAIHTPVSIVSAALLV